MVGGSGVYEALIHPCPMQVFSNADDRGSATNDDYY